MDLLDELSLLLFYVESKSEESRQRLVELLSRHITISYYAGVQKAVKDINAGINPFSVGVEGLTGLIDELSSTLEETFGYMTKDLVDVIKEGIKRGESYLTIKEQLNEILTQFGKRIPFQRKGRIREIVKVYPDGRMRLIKQEIKKNITISTDSYARMLSRTVTKRAYVTGAIEGYKAAGINRWRYVSVADERTRPHHLALHGRVFTEGTAESEMAKRVMSEPNCRCRAVAYLGGRIDAEKERYIEEKKRWAKQALDEIGDRQTKRREFLEKMLEKL